MQYQDKFMRYEFKYILNSDQKERLLKEMQGRMSIDQYGRDTIRNIYFDTDSYRLIRHSIEKPVYKEKLRLRSYRKAQPDTKIYVELKKKYKSIVYKRRLSMSERDAMTWLCSDSSSINTQADYFVSLYQNPEELAKQTVISPQHRLQANTQLFPDTQIAREIEYFRQFYETLHPVVFLSYEREAFYALNGSDFRVTFDDNILCRQSGLSLEFDVGGTPLLEEGKVLMELKTSQSIPLWMTHFLTQEQIYKTSFSKYGTTYQTMIYPQIAANPNLNAVNGSKHKTTKNYNIL